MSPEDPFQLYNMNAAGPKPKQPKQLYANLPLVSRHHHYDRTFLCTRLDLAADVNIMPRSAYIKLTGDKDLHSLGPVRCTMQGYTKDKIMNLGSTEVFVKYPGQPSYKLLFHVTDTEGSTLICCKDLLSLGLVIPKSGLEDVLDAVHIVTSTADATQVNATSAVPDPVVHCKEDIKKYFPDVVGGLGTFPGEPYKIQLNPTVPPK